jgi:L-threonylcarbamoyladenylate synthase
MAARRKMPALPEAVEAEVARALAVLRAGGVILYPTDTIWGLGCDATRDDAVEKVLRLKGRDEGKGFVVLLDAMESLGRYVKRVPDLAWDLVGYSTKPLTVIYPEGLNVSPRVTAPDGSLAVRVTAHPFCRALTARLGKPLVSTSANRSGAPFPGTFGAVDEALRAQVDYVVNLPAEKNRAGRPSAILRLGVDGTIQIIRK